jgi:predicted dehydrogenase
MPNADLNQGDFQNLQSALCTRMAPLKWGILGTSRIARTQVIPAMRQGNHEIVSVGSRDDARAATFARDLGIPHWYGSYLELLDDPDVDAIYNPLPNHLHVWWTSLALAAGKHVLCEKPIALSASEARELLAAQTVSGKVVAEAFMVRTHPQWLRAKELVREGRIGVLGLVTGHFSYGKREPADVRNKAEYGGGVLLDIGCYPIMLSRWLFGEEPTEVVALVDRDTATGVDRLTSGLLRFPSGQAAFTSAGELALHQAMHLYGTAGHLSVEIPFNPPPDAVSRIHVDDGRDLTGGGRSVIEFDPVNQYLLQADRFADAVRGEGDVPVSVEDAIANMAVIDALFRSAESGKVERND